jgi:hypothetical protein
MSPIDFYNIIKALPVGQSGFPTKKQMSDATGLNIYNVKLFLKGLVNSKKIRMEGNWYKFNEETLLEKYDKVFSNDMVDKTIKGHFKIDNGFPVEVTDEQAKDYLDHITEENKHYPDMEDEYDFSKGVRGLFYRGKNKTKIDSFTILRWVMGLIGISASVMSAYYTQIWQHETLSIFWSWFLSLIMIGFSSTAFLTLIGILTKSLKGNWKNIGIAIIFTILWVICLIYSVQVTVAGRFSQYQEILSKNNVVENATNANKLKIDNLQSSIDSLKIDKVNNQKQLDVLLNQYDYMQVDMGIKGETFQSIQNKITKVQGMIADINNKIENKNVEYEKIIGSDVITNVDSKFGFYDWAAKIYKTDRSNIEWWMLLFPSLFLDIASPIALAVFMFLGRRKEDEP